MLTKEDKSEIAAELTHSMTKQAASLEALRIVQHRHGWVSDELLSETASLLDMTPAELDAVATFYNFIFRKPVGRHVIVICDSISCWVTGYEPLYALLSSRLGIRFGETTADDRFTLLPASCLGACDRAPVMMVNEDLYGPVTGETIDTILGKYR